MIILIGIAILIIASAWYRYHKGKHQNVSLSSFYIAVALFCCPLVFSRLFALDDNLGPIGHLTTWLAFAAFLGVSMSIVYLPLRYGHYFIVLLNCVTIFMIIELGSRYIVNHNEELKQKMLRVGNSVHHKYAKYQGHPFMQFTGVPNGPNIGSKKLYNSLGFLGGDVGYKKPVGTVRIACLGGSTTASGYPKILQDIMNRRTDNKKFEVMNFGHDFYTTAHSLVNFVLNVRDFDPDFIIIHHAWNDIVATDAGGKYRRDYAHVFKPFEYAQPYDAVLIDLSVAYRLVRVLMYGETPQWLLLSNAISKPRKKNLDTANYDEKEYSGFKRNIRTIIDLAILDGSMVILSTQPFNADPNLRYSWNAPVVARLNNVIREIANGYIGKTNQVLLLDFDKESTIRKNVFIDSGHMTHKGLLLKAKQFAHVISSHL